MAPIARFGPLKIWQQKYFVKHSEPGLGCFLNPFCSEDLKISEEGYYYNMFFMDENLVPITDAREKRAG